MNLFEKAYMTFEMNGIYRKTWENKHRVKEKQQNNNICHMNVFCAAQFVYLFVLLSLSGSKQFVSCAEMRVPTSSFALFFGAIGYSFTMDTTTSFQSDICIIILKFVNVHFFG